MTLSTQTVLRTDSKLRFAFETWGDHLPDDAERDSIYVDVEWVMWLLDRILVDPGPRLTVIFHDPHTLEATDG